MPRANAQTHTSVALSKATRADLQAFQRTLSHRDDRAYTIDDILNLLLDYYIGMELTNN